MFPSSSTNSDHSDSRLSDAVYDIYLKLLSTLQGYQWRLHNDHRAPRVRPEPREPARSPSNPQGSRTQRITSILSFCLSKFRHFITKSTTPGRLEDSKLIYVLPASVLSRENLRDWLKAPGRSVWHLFQAFVRVSIPVPAARIAVSSAHLHDPFVGELADSRSPTYHPLLFGQRPLSALSDVPTSVPTQASTRTLPVTTGVSFERRDERTRSRPRVRPAVSSANRRLSRAQIASFVAHRQTQPYAREGKGDIYLVASVLNSDIHDFRRHRITGATLLEKVAFKGGHTKRMARRQMEYGKCEGRRRTLIWICRYTVQRRYYCERLFHLRLFERGGVRDVHKCTCKVAHREFLTFPSIGGLAQGHATMKSVLRAMGEQIHTTFFSPSPATKDIYNLILQS
ncbi:hypothetical protein B0H11DRAFT_1901855 [Mycena galericulata]|nr:hypothetical protein B0H11DRAFT_1901855 [Mycena galericulata]